MAEKYMKVDVEAVVCPKCGSDKRTKYHNTVELTDVIINGVCYGRVQLRRTSCKRCGQHRVERFFYAPQDNSATRRTTVRKPDATTLERSACTPRKNSKRKSKRSTQKSRAE